MFERLKKAAGNVKGNVEKARAFTRRESVGEYRAEQAELKERRRKNEQEFRGWKIDEDYRQKKAAYKKRKQSGGGLFGGGFINSIADIGANVNKNVGGGGAMANFNRAVGAKGDAPKRKKKKKGKVIQIRVV